MAIDRGVIDLQLRALGEGSRWWEQREMRDLPAVLHADEHILAIARGKVARLRWLRRSWLIVVTEKRLLCLRSAGRTSWTQFEVNAGQIARTGLRVGPFRGLVLVVAGGRRYRLLVSRGEAHKLLAALSSLPSDARETRSGFGPTLMVRRVIDHVLALPAAALSPLPPGSHQPVPVVTAITEERMQSLEDEVERLRQQVDFLEQLMRQQHLADHS